MVLITGLDARKASAEDQRTAVVVLVGVVLMSNPKAGIAVQREITLVLMAAIIAEAIIPNPNLGAISKMVQVRADISLTPTTEPIRTTSSLPIVMVLLTIPNSVVLSQMIAAKDPMRVLSPAPKADSLVQGCRVRARVFEVSQALTPNSKAGVTVRGEIILRLMPEIIAAATNPIRTLRATSNMAQVWEVISLIPTKAVK